VEYAALEDVGVWGKTIRRLVLERDRQPERWRARRAAAVARAAEFSWSQYGIEVVALYHHLARRVEAAC
jgi:hypothetical protein